MEVFEITRKIVLITFSMLLIFTTNLDSASAAPHAEVHQILIGNKATYKGPYYKDYGPHDAMFFDITSTQTDLQAVSVTYTSWADDTFTKPLTTKTYVPSQYGWSHFTGIAFNCNAHYTGVLRDKGGDIVLSIKMTVSGLEKPKCDSEPEGDMGDTDGDGSGGDGDGGDGDGDGDGGDGGDGSGGGGDGGDGEGNVCSTLICECIAELKPILGDISNSINNSNTILGDIDSSLGDINSNIDNTNNKLDKVNNNLDDLKETTEEIKEILIDFRDEFKTNIKYKVDPMPSVDDLLEQNKPEQIEKPFVDDTIYFEDQGDAEEVGKLPKAPEPKDWDGFKPEAPMPPEKEQSKDQEIKTDTEIKKDGELKAENFKQDAPLQQDFMGKDQELKKDHINQQPEFDLPPNLEKNHIYEQTNIFP